MVVAQCVIKLDYEKAYDRVNWEFLFEILAARGFDSMWIQWIEKIIKNGSMGVMLNGARPSRENSSPCTKLKNVAYYSLQSE